MDYDRLTPADFGLANMIASLTGEDVKPELNSDDTYTLAVPLTDDVQRNRAILRAVEGRAGKRLVRTLLTVPGSSAVVTIRQSDERLPKFSASREPVGEPLPSAGLLFCRKLDECRAVQVKRGNARQLITFVGNGEMEVPDDGAATFHFLNASGSVWAHAREGDYIMADKPGHFRIIPPAEFEAVWERK